MKAGEFIFEEDNQLYEVHAAWGRTSKGQAPQLKFRCGSGPRARRVVVNPAQCFAHPKTARAQRMKLIRAKTAAKQARKARRTNKTNIASRIIQQLNRMIKQ
jgi:hypothetical protein